VENAWSSGSWQRDKKSVAMAAETYLLDSSALLTLIEDEPGAACVEPILREQPVIITWMSLLEVYYISQQERGMAVAEQRHALLKVLPVTIIWHIEEPLLLTTARLKAKYHLLLADTIIAACAIRQNATILHKDPHFEALAGQVVLEALPYKSDLKLPLTPRCFNLKYNQIYTPSLYLYLLF
jgi:predicted nucleic acid-binding protein